MNVIIVITFLKMTDDKKGNEPKAPRRRSRRKRKTILTLPYSKIYTEKVSIDLETESSASTDKTEEPYKKFFKKMCNCSPSFKTHFEQAYPEKKATFTVEHSNKYPNGACEGNKIMINPETEEGQATVFLLESENMLAGCDWDNQTKNQLHEFEEAIKNNQNSQQLGKMIYKHAIEDEVFENQIGQKVSIVIDELPENEPLFQGMAYEVQVFDSYIKTNFAQEHTYEIMEDTLKLYDEKTSAELKKKNIEIDDIKKEMKKAWEDKVNRASVIKEAKKNVSNLQKKRKREDEKEKQLDNISQEKSEVEKNLNKIAHKNLIPSTSNQEKQKKRKLDNKKPKINFN